MNKRKNFSINKIEFSNYDITKLHRLFNGCPYSNSIGFGLSKIQVEENIISSTLTKRITTYISDYNPEKKQIEKKQIFLYSEIEFYIDFEFNLLYSIGPANNLNQVKILLRNILEKDYQISSPNLSPFNVYLLLKKQKIRFEIGEITINRFNYKDGAIGKFCPKISDLKIATELIHNYKNDSNKIVFLIKSDSEKNFKAQVYDNSLISIISHKDDINQNFQYLKGLIF